MVKLPGGIQQNDICSPLSDHSSTAGVVTVDAGGSDAESHPAMDNSNTTIERHLNTPGPLMLTPLCDSIHLQCFEASQGTRVLACRNKDNRSAPQYHITGSRTAGLPIRTVATCSCTEVGLLFGLRRLSLRLTDFDFFVQSCRHAGPMDVIRGCSL